MIKPGNMRQSITIQQPTGAPGGLGQVTWQTFTTARAELMTGAGREINNPQFAGADVSHTFRTRYIAGVTAKMRVVMGARIFRILYPAVVEEGTPDLLMLYCREVL